MVDRFFWEIYEELILSDQIPPEEVATMMRYNPQFERWYTARAEQRRKVTPVALPRLFKSTFPVGIRMCAMVFNMATKQLTCEWSPSDPGYEMLFDDVRMEQYRNGRDKLLADVSAEIGVPIFVSEELEP